MFRRILFSALSAAAIGAAAPALAGEAAHDAADERVPACCQQAMREREALRREGARDDEAQRAQRTSDAERYYLGQQYQG